MPWSTRSSDHFAEAIDLRLHDERCQPNIQQDQTPLKRHLIESSSISDWERLAYRQGCWAISGDAQNALELPVHGAKELGLIWQLALDVWSHEDVFQVQPLLLALEPLIQSVTEQP